MAGRTVMPPIAEEGNRASLPIGFVRGLLDKMEKPLIVAERSGRLLLVNTRARQFLESSGHATTPGLNLFNDLLKVDARKIFGEIEKGDHEVDLQIQRSGGKSAARVHWMPEPDWLVPTHGTRALARTRNHVPQSSGSISEIAGSEPAKDSVFGVSGARIENATRGNQGLL